MTKISNKQLPIFFLRIWIGSTFISKKNRRRLWLKCGVRIRLPMGKTYLRWVSIWHRLWRHFCRSRFCPPNLVLSLQYLHWPQSSFFRHPGQSPQNTRLRIPFPPDGKYYYYFTMYFMMWFDKDILYKMELR